ncbi:hypothetical protein BDK51DRAFT_38460 [Blyttiomyces helicus]|uniref:Uncharacterized protein n=1 Tax=Blyttiomyces helicus TaxID=388810 RepID=A0A4P9WKT2_9FUNG|nr:hypothetical protein BDK51DRAFT_38460 [Blyttiomyces helicus]|eukprot:RKO93434.1 hypothetical protein BDK51DRAFT_38460 [Blyttiomyces helicus]
MTDISQLQGDRVFPVDSKGADSSSSVTERPESVTKGWLGRVRWVLLVVPDGIFTCVGFDAHVPDPLPVSRWRPSWGNSGHLLVLQSLAVTGPLTSPRFPHLQCFSRAAPFRTACSHLLFLSFKSSHIEPATTPDQLKNSPNLKNGPKVTKPGANQLDSFAAIEHFALLPVQRTRSWKLHTSNNLIGRRPTDYRSPRVICPAFSVTDSNPVGGGEGGAGRGIFNGAYRRRGKQPRVGFRFWKGLNREEVRISSLHKRRRRGVRLLLGGGRETGAFKGENGRGGAE